MTRPAKTSNRLVAITLDENSIGRSNRDVEHERAVAIYDLLEDNTFAPHDADGGPFALHLSITGSRLMFDIRREIGPASKAKTNTTTANTSGARNEYAVCPTTDT